MKAQLSSILLGVRDMEKTKRLYTEGLGWKIKHDFVVAGGGLARKTSYLTLREGRMSVTDGPFIESKEFIPGFTIIQVPSREEAIEWASGLRRIIGDGEFRITQIFGPS